MDISRTEVAQSLDKRIQDKRLTGPAAVALSQFIAASTAKLAARHITPEEHNREITSLAASQREIDPFTGMFNKEGFNTQLEAAVELTREMGIPLTILIVDGDRFGEVNKQISYEIGDKVILAMANAIKISAKRSGDVQAHIPQEEKEDPARKDSRPGGDEFAIILPATNIDGAKVVGDRLRKAAAERVESDVPEYRAHFGKALTVSIGFAEFDPNIDDARSLAAKADISLRAEKRLKKFGDIPMPDLSDMAGMEEWITKWVQIPLPPASGYSAENPQLTLAQERRTLMYFVDYAKKEPRAAEYVLGILINAATRAAV